VKLTVCVLSTINQNHCIIQFNPLSIYLHADLAAQRPIKNKQQSKRRKTTEKHAEYIHKQDTKSGQFISTG
jgi:hypothetical protein